MHNFAARLPAAAHDVFYRDILGNISSSNMKVSMWRTGLFFSFFLSHIYETVIIIGQLGGGGKKFLFSKGYPTVSIDSSIILSLSLSLSFFFLGNETSRIRIIHSQKQTQHTPLFY